jgi:lipid II:glycine glycyltransferase (peptidoglycan interpeptide bridge formation enzyme)
MDNNDPNKELADKLRAALESAISEDTMKEVKKKTDEILDTIDGDLNYRLKNDLAPNLSAFVVEMAQNTVEQLLAGNEDQMRRYMGCQQHRWNGRSDGDTWHPKPIHEWHSVIHGRLFEQGHLAVRKAIVEAHSELLKNERILDLEDQVKSLVEQVNRANAEREKMWERVRALEPSF